MAVLLLLIAVPMVDMVDIGLEEKKVGEKEFDYPSESWYEIPVDKSTNMIHQELERELKSGKGVSRKAIQNAVRALSLMDRKESLSEITLKDLANHNPIYRQCFLSNDDLDKGELGERNCVERKYDNDEREIKDTRPARIHWEIECLIKAVTKARAAAYKGQLRGENLAKATLEILARDAVAKECSDGVPEDPRILLPLQDTLVRETLTSEYQDTIRRRLDLIWCAIIKRPPSAATKAMKAALHVLDQLIIDLYQPDMQAGCAEETGWENRTAQSEVFDLFKRLEGLRVPHTDNEEQETKTYHFQLYGDEHNFEELKRLLLTSEEKKRAANRKEVEKVYCRYIYARAVQRDEQGFQAAKEFLKQYGDLMNYIQGVESTEEQKRKIKEELSLYTQNIFRDADRGDCMPYSYSEFKADAGGSAFICEATKRAHERIHFAIHKPLQLLTIYACMNFSGFDILSDWMIECCGLTPRLQHWRRKAEEAIKELGTQYPELPLLREKQQGGWNVKEFETEYYRRATDVFGDVLIQEAELKSALNALQLGPQEVATETFGYAEYMGRQNMRNVAVVLRAAAQMVAAFFVTGATDEICEQYSILKTQLMR